MELPQVATGDQDGEFDRRPKLAPNRRMEALTRIEQGEEIESVARSVNVDEATIARPRT